MPVKKTRKCKKRPQKPILHRQDSAREVNLPGLSEQSASTMQKKGDNTKQCVLDKTLEHLGAKSYKAKTGAYDTCQQRELVKILSHIWAKSTKSINWSRC